MFRVKAIVTNRGLVLVLVRFAVLIAIATVAPLLSLQQAITGPIVNATFFISVVLLGFQAGILVGLVPSLIALSFGLLPSILAPMVPFIMMGNTILVVVFNYLKKKNFWLGIAVASLLKFLFLLGTSYIVIDLVLKKEIAQKVSLMMSWPQLLTALGGGLIAYLVLKSLKKI